MKTICAKGFFYEASGLRGILNIKLKYSLFSSPLQVLKEMIPAHMAATKRFLNFEKCTRFWFASRSEAEGEQRSGYVELACSRGTVENLCG